jgi:membrane dipeptidase
MGEDLTTRVRRVLAESPLIDGHNDTPIQLRNRLNADGSRIDPASFDFEDTTALAPPMHTDLRRLRAGGVAAQFWVAYVPFELAGPEAAEVMFEQLDVARRLVAAHPDTLQAAFCADDVERHHAAGKIASLFAVEGGHGINNSLDLLRRAYEEGARYMTLLHAAHTDWADCAHQDPVHEGLTEFGLEVVGLMNDLGMMIDLSHASADTMRQTIAASRAPVACTHSGALALVDFPRNVPDDVLRMIRDTGGIVMATFVPRFVSGPVLEHRARRCGQKARLVEVHPHDRARRDKELAAWDTDNPAPRATLGDVADHIDYLRAAMGVEHVGIGSDFDGIDDIPDGLEDVSRFPDLFVELARRGYTDDELRAIAGGNCLRVLRAVEAAARG